jgi:hypothetical protein
MCSDPGRLSVAGCSGGAGGAAVKVAARGARLGLCATSDSEPATAPTAQRCGEEVGVRWAGEACGAPEGRELEKGAGAESGIGAVRPRAAELWLTGRGQLRVPKRRQPLSFAPAQPIPDVPATIAGLHTGDCTEQNPGKSSSAARGRGRSGGLGCGARLSAAALRHAPPSTPHGPHRTTAHAARARARGMEEVPIPTSPARTVVRRICRFRALVWKTLLAHGSQHEQQQNSPRVTPHSSSSCTAHISVVPAAHARCSRAADMPCLPLARRSGRPCLRAC